MSRIVCLVLALCLCIVSSHTEDIAGRSLNRLVGQQPLLFGRRGINPNMNSLFFGKRSPAIVPPSLDELRAACVMLVNTYERVMTSDVEN